MKENTFLKTLLVAGAAAVTSQAWAHPGHGDESSLSGLMHLLEAEHLLPVLALVAAAWAARRLRRGRTARPQAKPTNDC
jgi:hydrogenase/urease accessory protein HupE